MDPFTPDRLEPAPVKISTGRENRPPRHRPGEKFLKGPIPWRWLEVAGTLAGKALAVGLVVWREAGCSNERTVPLNLSNLGIPRRTAQRALQSLNAAGLVSVENRAGRPPLVTLNELPGCSERAANNLPEGAESEVKCQNPRSPAMPGKRVKCLNCKAFASCGGRI